MQYRSIEDLNAVIRRNALALTRGCNVVVGVPRSGLLAANLLALHANLPLIDLEGFLAGRAPTNGCRAMRAGVSGVARAIVIDDSVFGGSEMCRTKQRVQAFEGDCEIIYASVYVAPGKESVVDRFAEICEIPRVFEWNIMHHSVITRACVDIDGVLCRDPMQHENDDGPEYGRFIETVEPLMIPTGEVDMLVTCRLEKYRRQTEEWLRRVGIKYRQLVMLELPTGEVRRRWGRHGEFKGEVYLRSGNSLFIESDHRQALAIANAATKPVLAMDIGEMIEPGMPSVLRVTASRLPGVAARKVNGIRKWLLKRIHPECYGVPQ